MMIHVKTVGTVKTLEKGSRYEILEVPGGNSVGHVIAQLKIQDWEIGFIKVNGQSAAKESILRENDEITLIAPLVGG